MEMLANYDDWKTFEPPNYLFAYPIGLCKICGNEVFADDLCTCGKCHPECCEDTTEEE